MPGVSFSAAGLNFGDVFRLLPHRVQGLAWKPSSDFELNGFGTAAAELLDEVYGFGDRGEALPSDLLHAVVEANPQPIDETILVFGKEQATPVVLIRSVRGDEWDVEAVDDRTLENFRNAVTSCRSHPDPTL